MVLLHVLRAAGGSQEMLLLPLLLLLLLLQRYQLAQQLLQLLACRTQAR
jgi:hypothetical protein